MKASPIRLIQLGLGVSVLQRTNGFSLSSFATSSSSSSSSSHTPSREQSLARLHAVFLDIRESAQRDIGTMEQWSAACGVQRSEGFQLTMTNDNPLEVEVMTTTDVQAQMPVLFVPQNMVLSARQCQQEIGRIEAAEQRLVSAKAAQHVPKFYLFVRLLQEFEQGDQSPYFPWFNSLPRYYSNGASMTPFCFECLPPLASALAQAERVKFIQFFQALTHVNFLSDQVKSSKELAKWVFAVIYTRGFATPADNDFKLAPVADLFNHAAVPNVQLSYDNQGNCCVYALENIPAGTPLRMQYADPTNPSFLFARYGFLDHSADATFCKIMIPRADKKVIQMGYAHNQMLFHKSTGAVSPEVWDVLLYQILGADPDVQQEFFQAHIRGDYDTKQAFHQHYYQQTSFALNSHVNTFLKDLENLQNKGVGKDLREHPRLPLIMHHNDFVKETFLAVQAQLAQYA